MNDLRIRRRDMLLGAAGLASGSGWAQPTSTWPARALTLVVPFPAGGGADAFARPLAAQFSRVPGRTLVTSNRGGTDGTLGASYAAKAAPDGYTLFMGGAQHAIAPTMYPRLDYDLEKDFIPLCLLVSMPQVLVVNPVTVPVSDFGQFLEQVRSKPGKLQYGTAGRRSLQHLAGELFQQQTGVSIEHAPYGADWVWEVLAAGNVDMMFDGLGPSAAHIRDGRVKALMVSGSRRNAALADVPCAAEVGLPDYDVSTWYGLWAPKGTPPDVQACIIEEMRRLGADEEIRAIWARNGAEYGSLDAQQIAGLVRNELRRWAAVVRVAGARLR
ncbi:tripartite tricarboxylate transporter substrate binding protein [Verminephrobacter aporrectodeae subsp. tuberculatae]|uniref:Bug family tripartite tricarboxylate transporter substrate binding protein n=1 Tax=Verminephrobacter aporrectodeae TaxID=1110389 RepID=UPI002242E42B|nr:tripartite tricarboxylate transporter substrate-binding protein [Verminephrobacter aporrectodeae]MCW8163860.1 tripartite tricarboxylate transporter substrate binding protein [Verminephrobacter aporrectodeae subsp. tuberculatae]MCW8168095.1 tripartite tricarboxylate transporter substrate binding protein [Verminephrobacter aporrectodeae subsp. tuberculatae]